MQEPVATLQSSIFDGDVFCPKEMVMLGSDFVSHGPPLPLHSATKHRQPNSLDTASTSYKEEDTAYQDRSRHNKSFWN
eukprot:5621699-Amphidinium_carterae.1